MFTSDPTIESYICRKAFNLFFTVCPICCTVFLPHTRAADMCHYQYMSLYYIHVLQSAHSQSVYTYVCMCVVYDCALLVI